MAWIAAAIGAVGGIVQAGIKADQKVMMPGGQAGSMDLGKMWYADSGMNNSGWIVTTNGSTANATANTDSTKNPSTSASIPSVVSLPGSGGGLDMNLILIAAAVFLFIGKK